MVEGGGFEPPKLTQQIYSLPPLAARESLQMQDGDNDYFLRFSQCFSTKNTHLFEDACFRRLTCEQSIEPREEIDIQPNYIETSPSDDQEG